MKVTGYILWSDLISYVTNRTGDINNILHSKIINIGFSDDIKDTKDAGLKGTCDELLGEIYELYNKVLEIKVQSDFINKEDKGELKWERNLKS